MSGRHDSVRMPPVIDGAAGRLAEELRQDAQRSVDEVSQARLERALYEAWRVGGAAEVSLPTDGRSNSRRRGRAMWGVSIAMAAAAGALLAFGVLDEQALSPYASGAHYELRIGDGGLQRGTVHPGETLRAGAHGHIDVELGYSRVELDRNSAVRFDRMTAQHLEMSLVEGRVDVSFHPPGQGVQTLAVQTRAAVIRVVGTRFSVEVNARGDTTVAVTEGVVEVEFRRAGEVRRVVSGESLEVLADPGDAVERAVRDALADELAEAESTDVMDFSDTLDVADMALDAEAESESRHAEARARRSRSRRTLASAREQLRAGKHKAARRVLLEVAKHGATSGYRAEAYTLVAESFTAQGYIPRAISAYRDAAGVASSQSAGHNALFAVGRLLERYQQDREGAADAYREYLERAPRGALASQANAALCRLGDDDHCPEPEF